MKCPHMTQFGENLAPCGQCMPCRINKKRMWVGRMLLELNHSRSQASFLTMTYNDEHCPKDFSLDVTHAQNYIKRLRERSMGGFRYFCVGEYGKGQKRVINPHYHMIVFGHPPETYEKIFQDAWPYGYTKTGEANQATMNYVANYTTKKLTMFGDERLDGRAPEFAIMSKKPPLGACGINYIEDLCYTKAGAAMLAATKDVPKQFEYQGTKYPIGKYWVNHLRERLGVPKPKRPDDWTVTVESILKDRDSAQKKSDKLWSQRNKARGVL